jgi:hypothetical protein
MHYKVDYKGMSPEDKQKKAVEDIKEYLGEKKFNEMESKFKEAGVVDPGQFEFICMVGGIEGYPVGAWYMSLFGDNEDNIE